MGECLTKLRSFHSLAKYFADQNKKAKDMKIITNALETTANCPSAKDDTGWIMWGGRPRVKLAWLAQTYDFQSHLVAFIASAVGHDQKGSLFCLTKEYSCADVDPNKDASNSEHCRRFGTCGCLTQKCMLLPTAELLSVALHLSTSRHLHARAIPVCACAPIHPW